MCLSGGRPTGDRKMSLNYSEVEELTLNEAPWREAARQAETSTDKQAPLLLAIEEAAARKDRSAIITLAKQVDWRSRRPDELIRVIQSCIFLDMVLLARELADEGRRLFPNDKRMEQWAIVLAPAKIIGTRPASANAKSLKASQRWFKNNSSQYKGQWVAVRAGELLGAASKLKDLHEQIGQGQRNSNTIIVKVLFLWQNSMQFFSTAALQSAQSIMMIIIYMMTNRTESY